MNDRFAPPMRHAQAQGLLASYAADDLEPALQEALVRHLSACAACQHDLAELRRMIARLHDLAAPPPALPAPSVADAVLAQLADPAAADQSQSDEWDLWPDETPAARPVLPPPLVSSPDNRPALLAGTNGHQRGTFAMEPTQPPINPSAPRPPAEGRARRSFPLLAAATLVALAAALIFGLILPRHATSPGSGVGPSASPTRAGTSQPIVPPTPISATPRPYQPGGFISAIQMLSATDGFAVGDSSDGTTASGVVLHYDGHSWQTLIAITGAQLNAVAMTSPTDGWAVGSDANNGPLLLNDAGGQWTQVHPNLPGPLTAVTMISTTEGWALGNGGEGGGYYVTHYLAGQWSAPLTLYGTVVYGVAATSASNAWIGGTQLFQRVNGGWQTVTSVPGDILALTLDAPNDGWAVGIYNGPAKRASGFGGPPLLMHFDGTAWTRMGAPAAVPTGTLYGVGMLAGGGTGWAVGAAPAPANYTRQSLILHYAGGQWAVDPASFHCDLNAVAAVSASEAWAVGACDNGTGANLTGLLHYLNGQWTQVQN